MPWRRPDERSGRSRLGLAEKIVGRVLDRETQIGLIERYLAELESCRWTSRISGYASAILDLAEAEGELSRVETEFLALGQALREVRLSSCTTDRPQLPLERKQAIVDDLIGGRASSLYGRAGVQFIVGQGRSSDIPEISEELHREGGGVAVQGCGRGPFRCPTRRRDHRASCRGSGQGHREEGRGEGRGRPSRSSAASSPVSAMSSSTGPLPAPLATFASAVLSR